ncbi:MULTISPECIES: hypothetical protein [Cyanophyceae]|uniref:hypothetical protein n=1 Tax=Cyanophyceae TaxID=3028117 RepID=UPI00016DCB8B|nr:MULTISPECIES: hypothetical protein [Cyanophyceae]ACA99687.1 hypothetical protein SYNPCC7002_A1698 [Picosynechococcus sp. PCC 7002]SMH56864.1 hypothetical protein SAMN06272755_3096 [Picosynechococcus sp. OG1]SMQ83513.1 hypothetical protein SAMN06272774_2372 [Synechococcus sp. 7002]
MTDFINEPIYEGKPDLQWIESYVRGNGTVVDGHWRTDPNGTIADNLDTDVDGDGIPGFFDADADGDGWLEAVDTDGDGVADVFQDFLASLGNVFEDLL